jgi:hypothetical protein
VYGGFLEDFKIKEPSTSVVVPAESPMILMLAPGIGRLLLSVTIPEIEFCAKVKLQKTMSKSKYTLIGYNLLVYVAKLQIFLILIKRTFKISYLAVNLRHLNLFTIDFLKLYVKNYVITTEYHYARI